MPERLECEVLQKARYINTLTFTFYLLPVLYLYLLLEYFTQVSLLRLLWNLRFILETFLHFVYVNHVHRPNLSYCTFAFKFTCVIVAFC